MISTIINRELLSFNKEINILCSRIEDNSLIRYITSIFDKCNIITFNNSYYGNLEPDIVICTNRILDLTESVNLCKFFHTPLLVIDTNIKSDLVTNKIDSSFDIHPVIQVAVNQEIYFSWNKIQDYVIQTDLKSIPKWQNIIYNLCKERFRIQTIRANQNEN